MSDYPELPELSDETLEAIIAYGVFWLHYSEKSEADAAIRLTENLRRPTESVEEWEERVPSYLQRQALRPSQVEDAAKRIREENATQQKWRFFSEPFRNQLQEQRRQRERAAFEEVRANVEVVAEPVRASEAYAALEASPLDPKSDWGSYSASAYVYHEVSLDGEFVGYVRRKPKQSFWSFARAGDNHEYNGHSRPVWHDGGYGHRLRKQGEAAEALVKDVIKARQAVSA